MTDKIAANEQDEVIFAALTAPLLTDVYGDLFALRSDGATVRIDRPGPRDEVCFFRPYTSRKHKWVATNKKLYLLLNGRQKYLIELRADELPHYTIAPSFSPVFAADDERGSAETVAFSTPAGVRRFEISGTDVSAGLLSSGYCLGGWTTQHAMFFAGMQHRRPELNVGEGHKRVGPALFRVDRNSGTVRNLRPRVITHGQIRDLLGTTYSLTRRTSLEIECWLAACVLRETPYLVAGLFDAGLLEDQWMCSALPADTDFPIVGICRVADDVPRLESLLYPYRFRQLVVANGIGLLYLMYWEQSAGNAIDTLRVLPIGASTGAEPKSMQIDGLKADRAVSFLDLHFESGLGFYGAIFLREELYVHTSYLIRSADGVRWTVVHKL